MRPIHTCTYAPIATTRSKSKNFISSKCVSQTMAPSQDIEEGLTSGTR